MEQRCSQPILLRLQRNQELFANQKRKGSFNLGRQHIRRYAELLLQFDTDRWQVFSTNEQFPEPRTRVIQRIDLIGLQLHHDHFIVQTLPQYVRVDPQSLR